MFETLDAEALSWVRAALAGDPMCPDDAARVSEIRALEELKCAAEARQAALAAQLRESTGTALEVALARRESHHRGRGHLGLARVAARELPRTWAAWRAGRVSQWRVTLVARETGCLTLAHRRQVDAEIAGDPSRLEAMGDREIVGFCRERAANPGRRSRGGSASTGRVRAVRDVAARARLHDLPHHAAPGRRRRGRLRRPVTRSGRGSRGR